MKKLFLSLMLIATCCMFFGCGQKLPHSDSFILLSVATDTSGQVTQSLQFSVDSQSLKAAGASSADIVKFIQALTTNVQHFRDEFYINHMLTYNANPNPDYQLGKGLIVTKAVYQEKSDTIGFSLLFTSQQAWRYYHHSSSEGNESDKVHQNHGFINKVISKGQFPFAGEVKMHDGTIKLAGQRYVEAYLSTASMLSIYETLQHTYRPDLVYDYATPYHQIKSDAAYQFADDTGLYHHTWMRNFQELSHTDDILLYTTEVNRGLWYLTFLMVVLAGCAIAILIIWYRKRKAKGNHSQN